jgi:DNA-binding XRE family transcriptional regulator
MDENWERRVRKMDPERLALVEPVTKAVRKAWRESGLTQGQFADKIDVNRSTISHVVNCLENSTVNPCVPSKKMLKHLSTIPAIKKYMRSAAEILEHFRTAQPTRNATEVERPRRKKVRTRTTNSSVTRRQPLPKVGHIWKTKDTRRKDNRVVITSVHQSKNPIKARIGIYNIGTRRRSSCRFDEFVKRFEKM